MSFSAFCSRRRAVLGYALVAALALLAANATLYQALVREQYSTRAENQLCHPVRSGLSESAESRPPPMGLSVDQLRTVCEPMPVSQRVKRFVMFATDCWPIGEAGDVLEHFQAHGVTYAIDIPGAKYSHAIWTSYLTGQLPTNYAGRPIDGDHFLKAINRRAGDGARPSVQYVGPMWSYLAILGHDNVSNALLADVRLEPEPLDVPFEHAHPWFFERIGFMQEYFRALVKHDRSVISHSAVFDHRQHGEHRALGASGVDFPQTKKLARRVQADFKTLKSWFDANPDYTLVLYSDHGVDEYHFGQYAMHGTTRDGNEPFLMLYNARFEPAPAVQRIDVVDVLPTLVQYFDADIPANSIGIAHTFVAREPSLHDVRIAARNALQLHASAVMRSVDAQTARLRAALDDALRAIERGADANGTAAAHASLRAWLGDVKESMYGVMSPPWPHALVAATVAMLTMLFIVVAFNPRLELFIVRLEYRRFAYELTRVFGLYAAPFTQIMYIYEGWLATHTGAVVWRLMAPALAFMLLRVLDTVPTSALVAALRRLVYRNAFVALAALLVSDAFHELVGLFNDRWPALLFGRPLVFLLASRLLWLYYARAGDARSRAFAQLIDSAAQLGDERRRRQLVALEQRSRAALGAELLAAGGLLLAAFVYIVTDESKAWYGAIALLNAVVGRGVHVAALLVFAGAGVLMPLWLLTLGARDTRAHNGEPLPFSGVERLVVPLNIVIFTLNKDAVTNQALLGLVNWQLLDVGVALACATKQLYAHAYASLIVARAPGSGASGGSRHLIGAYSIAHQIASMLFLVLPFFASNVYFKDVVNFDVHPFAGRVGLLEYDTFPLLSAAMMLVHKYGIFMLYAVYSITAVRMPDTLGPEARLYELAQPPPSPQPPPSSHADATSDSVAINIEQHEHGDDDDGDEQAPRPPRNWQASAAQASACVQRHEQLVRLLEQQLVHVHTTAALALQAGVTCLGLFAMLCLLSSKHAREEALSQALLCACLCAVHALLRLHAQIFGRFLLR